MFHQVFAESGRRETLVRSCILAGHDLTVPQVQSLNSSLGILPPSVGSGNGGGLVKRDHVGALVKSLFKDLGEDEIQKLINGIAGEASTKPKDQQTMDLMQAVSCLDTTEIDHFKDIVTDCCQELGEKHRVEIAKAKPSVKRKKDAEAAAKEPEKKKTKTARPSVEKPEKAKEPDMDLEKAMKVPRRLPDDGILPAQERRQPAEPVVRPAVAGRTRKSTPDCLKNLLPNIENLYITWAPDNRMVQVDFQGLCDAIFGFTHE